MMTDALTTGAERLRKQLDVVFLTSYKYSDPAKAERDAIASDPGVKALVEYVQRCAGGDNMLGERKVNAVTTLKLWERGE